MIALEALFPAAKRARSHREGRAIAAGRGDDAMRIAPARRRRFSRRRRCPLAELGKLASGKVALNDAV